MYPRTAMTWYEVAAVLYFMCSPNFDWIKSPTVPKVIITIPITSQNTIFLSVKNEKLIAMISAQTNPPIAPSMDLLGDTDGNNFLLPSHEPNTYAKFLCQNKTPCYHPEIISVS